MTETGWLASTDPAAMLDFLVSQPGDSAPRHQEEPAGRMPSDRKLRLFAVACCRAVWPRLTDPRSRTAVEVAERFADGLAAEAEREGAWNEAIMVVHAPSGPDAPWAAARTAGTSPALWLQDVVGLLEKGATASLLREIAGDPFRPVAICACCWRSCHPADSLCHGCRRHACIGCVERHGHELGGAHAAAGGEAVRIAQDAYGSRDFAALPYAADALEEAGCDCGPLLRHLRGQHEPDSDPTPWEHRQRADSSLAALGAEMDARLRAKPVAHVRGCWALDLVLGKE